MSPTATQDRREVWGENRIHTPARNSIPVLQTVTSECVSLLSYPGSREVRLSKQDKIRISAVRHGKLSVYLKTLYQ
jgi:hypothetical protein